MPVVRYYYLAFDLIDPQTGIKIDEIFRPYVPVRISLGHSSPSNGIDCLVDSGADRNLLPVGMANLLRINLKKCEQVVITGIGGIQIKCYRASFNIWLDNVKYPTEADFSPDQQVPLLGR